MAETPYAETEMLLAVMNKDDLRLEELLDNSLPGELDDVQDYCQSLIKAINKERVNRAYAAGEGWRQY